MGDAGRGEGRREAQVATGEGLAETHDVRFDAGVLRREQPPAPAEAGGDLVEDQQHVVALAQCLDVGEVFRRVEPHPPGALDDGLQDHGGDVGVVLRE